MNMRDDSLQLCAEGFYGLSPTLYRPRAVSFGFMHRGGRKCLSSSLPTPLRGYCYAVRQAERRDSQTSVWHGTTFPVAFLPLALRQRTHRNTITFETCKRTEHRIA